MVNWLKPQADEASDVAKKLLVPNFLADNVFAMFFFTFFKRPRYQCCNDHLGLTLMTFVFCLLLPYKANKDTIKFEVTFYWKCINRYYFCAWSPRKIHIRLVIYVRCKNAYCWVSIFAKFFDPKTIQFSLNSLIEISRKTIYLSICVSGMCAADNQIFFDVH